MYEDITYEVILKRMLDRVPGAVDKREGSIIYDALAPAAVEMTNLYVQLDAILNETFADTASRYYLVKRAAERGVIPYEATAAIWRGVFNIDIPGGTRFSLDKLNYVVIDRISAGNYRLQCETVGAVGNSQGGKLIPIDYIDGLTSAELVELLIPGEDEEDTESLRQRYFDSLHGQAFGGNIADYKLKTGAIPGVGGVKVYPVWNGGGTVKLVITDATYGVPSPALIDTVQTAVDPIPNNSQGQGFAPIGHWVTVEGVTTTIVDVVMQITYDTSYAWADIQPYAEQAIDAYFTELAADWENQANLIVRISQIETRVLNIQGVIDVMDTTLNSAAQNLVLGPDSIPRRGVVVG